MGSPFENVDNKLREPHSFTSGLCNFSRGTRMVETGKPLKSFCKISSIPQTIL